MLLLFASCDKENRGDCFKAHGKVVTEERNPGSFRAIRVEDHIHLSITEDTLFKVDVRAGKNILPLVRTELNGDTLLITDDNTCSWVRSYDDDKDIRVFVHLPELVAIDYRSTADLRITNTLHTRTFRFNQWKGAGECYLSLDVDTSFLNLHTGLGDVICSGTVTMSYLYNSSKGFIHAEDYASRDTWVTNNGTGDIHLHANNTLWAFVNGEGYVYYRGGADIVEKEVTGRGKLEKSE